MRGKLDAIKRYRDETMLGYVNRVLDIRDAMLDRKRFNIQDELSDHDIEEIEAEVLEGFINGLDPELRLRMRNARGRPLGTIIDEAIAAEKQRERDLTKHGRSNGRPIYNSRSEYERGYNRDRYTQMYDRPDRRGPGQYSDTRNYRDNIPRRNNNEYPNDINREGFSNYRDHRRDPSTENHSTIRNPPPRNQYHNQRYQDRPNDTGRRDPLPTCNYCKKKGHVIEDCYSRKWQHERKERQNQGNGGAGHEKGAPGPSNATKRPVNMILQNDES